MRLDNVLRKTTPVVLDKPRKLLITLNALVEIDELTGHSIMSPNDWGRPSIKVLLTMLAAFARHEDPEVTVKQIAKAVNVRTMPALLTTITTAWQANVGKGKEADASQSFETPGPILVANPAS